jgi:Fur family transcriptional regulator, ferric uptake regulator
VNGTDLHCEAARRLATFGQRLTTGRRALLDTLKAARAPLSAAEVVATDPRLAQSSVYRNFQALELAGVVTRHTGLGGEHRFELAEPFVAHHHHLVCRSCGRLADCVLDHRVEDAIGRAARTIARRHGFTVDEHRIDLIGLCTRCR